jgi:iron complex transport system ATP-binding protein
MIMRAAERLSAQEIVFGYQAGLPVIDGVSLALRGGEFLSITGPNGSGKTTLLRLLTGFLSPWSGEVFVGDRRLAGMSRLERARRIGFLPQGITSAFEMSVFEVVALGRHPYQGPLGFLTPADVEIIEESLNRTETRRFRDRPFGSLSGGERQRVLIASVLAQDTEILLLDEPTSALDIHHQAEIMALLRSLTSSGLAVAIVTHDLNLASDYCDQIALVNNGRIECEGTPEEVFEAERLEAVYGSKIVVHASPVTGRPLIVPVPILSREKVSAFKGES